jgi:hypothetical protein
MMIVNDDSRVINKLETSLIDDARFVIYECNMFMVHVTCFYIMLHYFVLHYYVLCSLLCSLLCYIIILLLHYGTCMVHV